MQHVTISRLVRRRMRRLPILLQLLRRKRMQQMLPRMRTNSKRTRMLPMLMQSMPNWKVCIEGSHAPRAMQTPTYRLPVQCVNFSSNGYSYRRPVKRSDWRSDWRSDSLPNRHSCRRPVQRADSRPDWRSDSLPNRHSFRRPV